MKTLKFSVCTILCTDLCEISCSSEANVLGDYFDFMSQLNKLLKFNTVWAVLGWPDLASITGSCCTNLSCKLYKACLDNEFDLKSSFYSLVTAVALYKKLLEQNSFFRAMLYSFVNNVCNYILYNRHWIHTQQNYYATDNWPTGLDKCVAK